MKEFLLANRDPALIGILALAVVVCALFLVVGIKLGMRLGRYRAERAFASRRDEERRDAVRRSRAVLGGQFSEQLAPYLPGFPGDPTEARFIGKPVDFISFSGSSRGKIDEVVFIEVKTGESRLSAVEQSLRSAVESGRVRYVEYRVPSVSSDASLT